MSRAYATLTPAQETFLGGLSEVEQQHLLRWWDLSARPDQKPREVPTWLILGGRGSGKTRSGAEWVMRQVHRGARRIALVAPTLHAAKEVMLAGESGLLNIGYVDERPVYHPTRRRLVFHTGAEAFLFSAFDPDSLRGPQFDAAWGDELCAWADPDTALANLRMGLRLGDAPKLCLTTTPRPIRLLDTLMAEPGCRVSRSRTADNADHLPDGFIEQITAQYGGTEAGRQELDGEIVRDHAAAVFKRDHIAGSRVAEAPKLDRILVALDPPATSGPRADACGIMVVGCAGWGDDAHAYVLLDATMEQAAPEDWATVAVALFKQFDAEAIIAEVNQGGEMVESVIRQADPSAPVIPVHASRSKRRRAVPVGMLYARGRVHHVGDPEAFRALEDELCAFGGKLQQGSPDRMDALVWGVSELLLADTAVPRVTFL